MDRNLKQFIIKRITGNSEALTHFVERMISFGFKVESFNRFKDYNY